MSSPLAALLWAAGRVQRHRLAALARESRLKIAFVSLSALLLWLGAFALCRGGLELATSLGGSLGEAGGAALADLLMARLLSVFALALFSMLIVSNVLVAYATFYRAEEMRLVVQSPAAPAAVFLGRFYDCVFMSSWALAFLGSPLLLAYGLERGAPPSFYLALVIFYLPFVVIPAAIGALLAMVLVRVLARLSRGRALAVGAVVLVLLGSGLRATVEPPDLSDAATIRALVAAMAHTESSLLPSFWLARGLLAAAAGELGQAGFYALVLVANALLAVWLAAVAAERWLYPGYAVVAEGGGRSRRRRSFAWLDAALRPLPQPGRALVLKDVKLFWRDAAQWSQFLLFFGILVLYVANLGDAGAAYRREPWRSWIAALNVAACLLVLATLTTRFVYPLISLEGRRFWILGLAPVRRRWVAWQKLFTSAALCSLFTVALALLSAWRLELEPSLAAFSVASVLLATAALSGLAVGLGSLYPNFEEESPSRIVSGMGGTLNFILSLVYVLLVVAAVALAVHAPTLLDAGLVPPWIVPAAAAWVVLLSALATWLPMHLGARHLERLEL
ncbi:MAG: hypothetical protein D6696_00415 [Acidobacteria bacterium]|nr:MAG: hypothetical protein D6696_00415 [Acidobacteriota bacterium]